MAAAPTNPDVDQKNAKTQHEKDSQRGPEKELNDVHHGGGKPAQAGGKQPLTGGKVGKITLGGKTKPQATRRKPKSRSRRASLEFPVSRMHRYLRKGHYADHIGEGAPVYLAAVIEYLVAEVLELAGNAAHDNKR